MNRLGSAAVAALLAACGGTDDSVFGGGAGTTSDGGATTGSGGSHAGGASSTSTGGGGASTSTGAGGAATGTGGAATSAGGSGGASTSTTGSGGAGGASTSTTGSGGAAGSGGAGGATTGTGGAGGCAQDPRLVDDLEDGDERIAPCAGRTGYWYTVSDGTGSLSPAPGALFLPAPTAPPRAGSAFSAHVVGSGLSLWGAVAKVDFANPASGKAGGVGAPAPYDVSAHQGLAFWARGSSVRVEIRQRDLVTIAEGGTCAAGCSDFHGVDVPLTGAWSYHEVPFAKLAQRGFGAPVAFDPKHAFGPQVVLPTGSFDVWIDDVRLY